MLEGEKVESNFLNCAELTLQNEGFVLEDKDGYTRYGITDSFIRDAKEFFPDDASLQNIQLKELSEAQALYLYRRNIWDRYGYDRINDQPILQQKLFDFAVNAGQWCAVHTMQKAINELQPRRLLLDGKMGPKTVAAILDCDSELVLRLYKVYMCMGYCQIVMSQRWKGKYIKGWFFRAIS